MKDNTELKPCPFCGGEAECCLRHENELADTYVVKCMDCGATSTPASVFKNRAIKIWNEVADK